MPSRTATTRPALARADAIGPRPRRAHRRSAGAPSPWRTSWRSRSWRSPSWRSPSWRSPSLRPTSTRQARAARQPRRRPPTVSRRVGVPEPWCAKVHGVTGDHPQDYYDEIKQRFAEERDLRLAYWPEGTAQFTSELTGDFARYAADPYVEDVIRAIPSTTRSRCSSSAEGSPRC